MVGLVYVLQIDAAPACLCTKRTKILVPKPIRIFLGVIIKRMHGSGYGGDGDGSGGGDNGSGAWW